MLELNKIYVENCLDTMARLQDGCIDLVVTSPPYDNLRTYNGYLFDFERIAQELWRVIKPGGVVVWVVGDATINGSETGTSFRQALYFKELGFRLHDTMIYEKKNAPPLTHNRYEQKFEYMFVLSKGKPITFQPIMKKNVRAGAKRTSSYYQSSKDNFLKPQHTPGTYNNESYMGNIWSYGVGGGKIKHPAIFPEQLAIDHIVTWSNEGELVYDPFMGSGTTAAAAQKTNRKWLGSEVSQEYADIANSRLNQLWQ